jgi:transposase
MGFPTDDACLEDLVRVRYGVRDPCRCNRESTYHRVVGRRCYECASCGFQVYPTAGTPFEATRTGLRDWLFVMFLFCASRNGVAAKEVQRQLGVTYKTAWRMCRLIREHMAMADGDFPLGGNAPKSPVVEVDETFIGGETLDGAVHKMDNKSIVLGMIERGGKVVTRVVPNVKADTLVLYVLEYVKSGTRVATDENASYFDVWREGCWHASVIHSLKECVGDDVHTNTMEVFWANVKRGAKGTYVHVSEKYLQTYLCEFEFRHNLAKAPHLMIEALLRAFVQPRLPSPATDGQSGA